MGRIMSKSYSKKYRKIAEFWFIVATILCIIGLWASLHKGYLPIGIATVSLGLGAFSIGLGYDSSSKFTANANKSFLEIVDVFENKRIDLFRHNERGDPRLIIEACWKCRTYFDRAVALTEDFKIDTDNQGKLYSQLFLFVKWSAIPWDGIKVKITKGKKKGKFKTLRVLRDTDIKNISEMCTKAKKLELTSKQREELKEITDFVEKYSK
jgi:hypothetical protein